jgi:hypothetical protein
MGLDELKQKVQRMLTEIAGTVRVDKNGEFIINFKSATAFIECWEQEYGKDKKSTRFGVLFRCPLVRDLPVSNELFRYIATENDYRFGSLVAFLYDDDRKVSVFFDYSILANDLDASEVENALLAVLYTSDELDTEIHKRFGGTMFGTDRE